MECFEVVDEVAGGGVGVGVEGAEAATFWDDVVGVDSGVGVGFWRSVGEVWAGDCLGAILIVHEERHGWR